MFVCVRVYECLSAFAHARARVGECDFIASWR
jgi:hypothetical protein